MPVNGPFTAGPWPGLSGTNAALQAYVTMLASLASTGRAAGIIEARRPLQFTAGGKTQLSKNIHSSADRLQDLCHSLL